MLLHVLVVPRPGLSDQRLCTATDRRSALPLLYRIVGDAYYTLISDVRTIADENRFIRYPFRDREVAMSENTRNQEPEEPEVEAHAEVVDETPISCAIH